MSDLQNQIDQIVQTIQEEKSKLDFAKEEFEKTKSIWEEERGYWDDLNRKVDMTVLPKKIKLDVGFF